MKPVDEYFDKIMCLCLDKRIEAGVVSIFSELHKYGGSVYRFLAGDGKLLNCKYDYVDATTGAGRMQAYNYSRCIKTIIEKAKNDGVNRLLFLEDDATLSANFEEVFPKAMDELEDLNWDALFLGGIHRNGLCYDIEDKKHLILVTESLDLHAIAFNNSIFDDVLALSDCVSGDTFDGYFLSLQRKKNVLAINPSIIIQKPTYSYNHKLIEDKVWQYDDVNKFFPNRPKTTRKLRHGNNTLV